MMRLSIAAFVLNSAAFQFQPKVQAEEQARRVGRLKATIDLAAIQKVTDPIPEQQLFDYFRSYLLLADTKASSMLFRRMMAGVKSRENWCKRDWSFSLLYRSFNCADFLCKVESRKAKTEEFQFLELPDISD
jgi:hypothetical protein